MKTILSALVILSTFSSVAQAAKSDCTLECDSKICSVVMPSGEVYATYEKNYKYVVTDPSHKTHNAVQLSETEQKADLQNLMVLCALKSVK